MSSLARSVVVRPRVYASLVALSAVLALAACGGGDDTPASTPVATQAIPAPPADPGFVDTAAAPSGVPPFVDNIATNQRGDARYATLGTNAGVRLFTRFLDLWQPLTEIVDAGVNAPANGAFPAVVASSSVSYTHLTLPTKEDECRSRWSPYH